MAGSFNAPGDKVKVIKDLQVVGNANVKVLKSGAAINKFLPKGEKGKVKENTWGTIVVELEGDYSDLKLEVKSGVWGTFFGPDGGGGQKTELKLKADLVLKNASGIKILSREALPDIIPKGAVFVVLKSDGKTTRGVFGFTHDKKKYAVTMEIDVARCARIFAFT